jgi:hypothetical protein
MAYLGPPPSQKLATPTSQYFSGNGSTTAFTLNRPVNVAEDLNVFVNNVPQEPGSGKSYTATGTTLTFDAAPASGTNNIYVVYRGLAEPTTRLEHPSGQPLAATTGTFTDNVGIGNARTEGTLHVHTASAGTVTASTQADDLVVENSAEGGITIITPDDQSARIRFTSPSTNTDVGGATIFYRQNINKMNVGTAVSGGKLDLLSGAGVSAILADGDGNVTMAKQPSFMAEGSWSYDGSYYWKGFGTIDHNIGSHWNNTTGTWTCPIAGRYLIYATMYHDSSSNYHLWRFNKNNVGFGGWIQDYNQVAGEHTTSSSAIVSCAANDTLRFSSHSSYANAYTGAYNKIGVCLIH